MGPIYKTVRYFLHDMIRAGNDEGVQPPCLQDSKPLGGDVYELISRLTAPPQDAATIKQRTKQQEDEIRTRRQR